MKKLLIAVLGIMLSTAVNAQMQFCGKYKICVDTDQKERLESSIGDCWTFEVFDDTDFKEIEYRKPASVKLLFPSQNDLVFFVEKLLEFGKAGKKELQPCIYDIKEKDDQWKSTNIKIDQYDRLLHFTVTKYPVNGEGVVSSTTLLNLSNLKTILKELR